MTWILIIMMHVGAMGSGNSNALTSVNGFENQQACVTAGEAIKQTTNGTVKVINYICASSK